MNRIRCRCIFLLTASSLICPVTICPATRADARRPNVILIMADDMGYESLRSNGGTSYDSRLLDQIAARGMRFTHCYSQPICTPSRNKIMTGRSNARNYRAFSMLLPTEVTFGHVMLEAGYKTCIAGKWQLAGGGPNKKSHGQGTSPQRAGFAESCMWAYVHDLPSGVEHTGGWEKPGKPSRYWHPSIVENGEYRPTTLDDYGPDIFTQFILDFVDRNRTEPFFVYYPMALTHDPFQPTPHSADLDDTNKFSRDDRYFGDMIDYTGHCVERIVNKLDELGIAEETLLIFTTDNGTHRSLISRMQGRIIPGGKGLPVDAGCHVPMIACWKGTIATGTVCTDLIDFSDFLPTIAELGEAQLPSDRTIDGQSFLGRLQGGRAAPRDSVVVHYDKDADQPQPGFRRVRFAFDGRHKLYLDGRLFDVPQDWEEENPLDRGAVDATTQQAVARLQGALDTLPAWQPDNSAFATDEDKHTTARLARLQALREAE